MNLDLSGWNYNQGTIGKKSNDCTPVRLLYFLFPSICADMAILTRLIIAAFAAAASALAGIELRYRLDPSVLLLEQDPVTIAERLAEQSQWAEAKMLADFVVAHPATGDAERAGALSKRMDQELNTFWGAARRFSHGAVTGEPSDTASMLGSLTLDLFVLGDIRDLAVQGWREITNGDGDKLILALSTVGVVTTLAPEIDWVPALVKALKRSGALTRRFVRNLGRSTRRAAQTGDYSQLSKVANDLGSTARHLGPGPMKGAMRYVDNTDDLAKLSRAASVDAGATYGVVKLFGREGVSRIAKDGGNIKLLASAIKVGSRATKLTRKATHAIPTPGLLIWLLISLLALYMSVRPRYPRTRQRPAAPPPLPARREPTLRPAPEPSSDAPRLPSRRSEPSLSASELPLR